MDRRNLIKQGAGALAVAGIGIQVRDPVIPRHVALLVLDRSGSMTGLEEAVVNGVNAFLDEQASTAMYIGIVQFDSQKANDGGFCEWIFPFTPASQTPRLTRAQYQPRGGTPLFEAVTESIAKLDQEIRPQDRALLIFQTDGKHAHPRSEITKEVVTNLKSAKEALGNWTFGFMGAGIDAWDSGVVLAYTPATTLNYVNTTVGTGVAWATTSISAAQWYVATGGLATDPAELKHITANTNTNFYHAEIPKDDASG